MDMWPRSPQVLMRVLAIGPWKLIKATSLVLNKWQRLVSPISYAIFLSGDAMDRQTPTVRAILVWFWNTISLGLHFVDVSFRGQPACADGVMLVCMDCIQHGARGMRTTPALELGLFV